MILKKYFFIYATTLPTLKDPVILIDAGANSESTAEMLLQFALMGSTFVEKVYNKVSKIITKTNGSE